MRNNATRTPSHFLVLPAAGSGQRMGGDRPKQYLELLGKPLLQHTLERLVRIDGFECIVLVLAADDPWWPGVETALSASVRMKLKVVEGGSERFASVQNGLLALHNIAADNDWVLVHDVVRPCVGLDDVERLMQTLRDDPVGGLLASPVRETLKRADGNEVVLVVSVNGAVYDVGEFALVHCVVQGVPNRNGSRKWAVGNGDVHSSPVAPSGIWICLGFAPA